VLSSTNTAVLIAGATAAASDTASQAVKDAYRGLKTLLAEDYKIASTALLEKNPTNPTYQKVVEDELKENAAVASDKWVLEKTKVVQDALRREPPARLAAWGIDIKQLEAGGRIVVERIAGAIVGREFSGAVQAADYQPPTRPKK
jgi:hypothetical protein